MQQAQIEGVGTLEFPDETSKDTIDRVVKETIAARVPQPAILPDAAPVSPQPSLISRALTAVRSAAPQAAGALIGGISGTAFGLPGRIIGSGLGAGVGEAGQIGLEKLGLAPEPSEPASAISRIGSAVGGGAIGELGGTVIIKGIQKLLAPFARTVTPSGKEAIDLLGKQVLPAQVTSSRTLDVLDNVASSSLLGGGRMAAFKSGQQEAIDQISQNFVNQLGPRISTEEAGHIVADSITAGGDAFRAAARSLYKRVDDLVGTTTVDMQAIKAFAADELTRRGAIPGEVAGKTGVSLLKQIGDMPDRISFEQAQFFRSELLKVTRSASDARSDVIVGLSKQLGKQVGDALDEAASQIGPDAKAAYDTANAFYRNGKEQFYSSFLRKLVDKDPERIVDAITRPGAVTTVQAVKAAATPEAFQGVQSAFTQKLLSAATDTDGNLSGAQLTNALKRLGNTTGEVLGTSAPQLNKFARVLVALQQRQGEGAGKVFIQLKQAGAMTEIGGLVLGGSGTLSPGVAGTIILGPAVLSHILTNPMLSRFLTTGLTLPPGSPEAIRATTQLVSALRTQRAGAEIVNPQEDQIPPLTTSHGASGAF